ncbi:MAG: S8 family serine peptidase [Candidatus Moranbacteria bacterium]|jgi:hypothetical protein|nr:S8 family serine peptidase [Candidatus Moranbacteria bacterium]
MKKKKLVLIILGLSFWGGLFLNGSYCWGADKGKIAIINSNFYGLPDETLNNGRFQTYDAYLQSSTNPINLRLYPSSDPIEDQLNNSHGMLVTEATHRELSSKIPPSERPNFLLIKTSPNDSPEPNAQAVIRAVRYAADQGADVINLSLSLPTDALPEKDPQKLELYREIGLEMESALQYARSKGSVIVASSGNDGRIHPVMDYPGSSKYTIAVGAHDSVGHPTSYTSGVGDSKLDFTARVGFVDDNGNEVEGTSYAAPVVTADAYLLMKTGDPFEYDLDGDGQLSQDEVKVGLENEAGNKFDNISSITYDRVAILKERYDFETNSNVSIGADILGGGNVLVYDPNRLENYIEGSYLNTGRFNEFYDSLDDVFADNEYCYKSDAFQVCGFDSMSSCEGIMSQELGGCGKVGDLVSVGDNLLSEEIMSADIDGDGIPDGEADGNFWDDLLGGGEPNADSGEENNTGADGCAAGFAMENGICMPSSSGLHSPEGSNPMLEVLRRVMLWLLSVIGFIAIVAFVISGIQYLISAGDQNMIETAKRNMKWSIVGVVTALSGLIILQFIYIMMS